MDLFKPRTLDSVIVGSMLSGGKVVLGSKQVHKQGLKRITVDYKGNRMAVRSEHRKGRDRGLSAKMMQSLPWRNASVLGVLELTRLTATFSMHSRK
jgi:hypothetical protein